MHIEFKWENLRERDLQGSQDRELEEKIKVDLREVGCDAGDWIDLTQNRDQ